MDNIIKSIQEKNAERALNILKGFSEVDDILEKSRSGVYADNAENRKLQRVGQKFGSEKNEDEISDKKSSKQEGDEKSLNEKVDDNSDSNKNNTKQQHQKFIDEIPDDEKHEQLQNFIDKNPNPEDEETKKLVNSAKSWLKENPESDNVDQSMEDNKKVEKEDKKTHSKIDKLQSAIDDLKNHTNHPNSNDNESKSEAEDNLNYILEQDYKLSSEQLLDAFETFMDNDLELEHAEYIVKRAKDSGISRNKFLSLLEDTTEDDEHLANFEALYDDEHDDPNDEFNREREKGQ